MTIPTHKLPIRSAPKPQVIVTHCVDISPDIAVEDVLNPLFWQNLTGKLRLGDEVLVRPTDYSYRLHAEVVAIDPAGHWAAIRQISLSEGLPFAADAADEGGYSYGKDPVQGYRVLRGKDLVEANLPDEAAAIARIEQEKGATKVKRIA